MKDDDIITLPDFEPPPEPQPRLVAAPPPVQTPRKKQKRQQPSSTLDGLAPEHLDTIQAKVTSDMVRALLNHLTYDWRFVAQVRQEMAVAYAHSGWFPADRAARTQDRLIRKIAMVGLQKGHPICAHNTGIKLGDREAVLKSAKRSDAFSRGHERKRDLLLAVAAKMDQA